MRRPQERLRWSGSGRLDLYAFLAGTWNGQVQGAIEYVRDITERKVVEEAPVTKRNRDLALLNR